MESHISNLIVLITLHCIADYPLQGDFLAKEKGKNDILMHAHCFIWSGLIFIGLKMLGLSPSRVVFYSLFLGHLFIDKWKCSRSGNGKELTTDLAIDQLLHIIQIIVAYIICVGA